MISIRNSTRWAIGLGILLVQFACADVAITPFDNPPAEDVLTSVVVSPRGTTMAVGDTERMTVTGYNLLGNPIPYSGEVPDSVVFLSADTTRVHIDSLGNMTALRVTTGSNPLRIVVSWTRRGITRSDTTFVKVNATRPDKPVASIHIESASGGTFSSFVYYSAALRISALDVEGGPVSGVYAYLETDLRRLALGKDPINPQSSVLYTSMLGKFWIYAESRVYGVTLRDSVLWSGTYIGSFFWSCIHSSTRQDICLTEVAESAAPLSILEQCAIVTISNATLKPIRFEIDDSTMFGTCQDGDETGPVGVLQPGGSAVRRLSKTGTTFFRGFLLDSKQTQVKVDKIEIRKTPE